MAKNHSFNGNTLTYNLPGESVTVDLSALPENITQKALEFAIPTLLRNATAGLLNEDPAKAIERVKARISAWLDGKWSSKSESSAEPRSSLLVLALSEALTVTASAAQKMIEDAIEAAQTAANVDTDSLDEADVKAAKAIAKQVRDAFGATREVAPILQRLKVEAAQKAADAKLAETSSKPSIFDLTRKP